LVAGEGVIVKVVKVVFREAEEGVGKGAAGDLGKVVDKRVEITLAREERMPKRESAVRLWRSRGWEMKENSSDEIGS
jgi:hypothetical protein